MKAFLIDTGQMLSSDPNKAHQAAEYFERAIRADPQFVDGYFWLAYCLWECVCDWEKAEHVARQGLALAPERADLHLVLAWILERLHGYTKEYENHLEQAISLEPTWLAARCCLIEYLLVGKDFDRAARAIQEAMPHVQSVLEVPLDHYSQWKYEHYITGRASQACIDYLISINQNIIE